MPMQHPTNSTNLLEVLEKILDKGIVIAGDIKISIAEVELLTIRLRLVVASVDKAKEVGLDWWVNDPYWSSMALKPPKHAESKTLNPQQDIKLLERIERLEGYFNDLQLEEAALFEE